MNSKTLINLDNLSKLLVVDPHLDFTTRKIYLDSTYLSKLDASLLADLKKTSKEFSKKCCIKTTTLNLLTLANNNKLLYLHSISKKQWVIDHCKIYLQLINPTSGFLLQDFDRYSLEKKRPKSYC